MFEAREVRFGVAAGFAALAVVACSSETPLTPTAGEPNPSSPNTSQLVCNVSQDPFIDSNAGVGAIPALHDPAFVSPGSDRARYLRTPDEAGTANIRDHDRVIVVRLDGDWVAIPHNILWWHEVAHFSAGQADIVVTYCPLTGSSLAFRLSGLRVSQFAVSGLLYNSNLVMRDPATGSLWPQMSRGAVCGPLRGQQLQPVPALEVRWEAWTEIHPDTRVLSSETGFDRNYSEYPYGKYEEEGTPPVFEVERIDDRRPFKERVLGVPDGTGGIAYPFGELSRHGRVGVVRDSVGAMPLAVLWNDTARAAAAYRPSADGKRLTLVVEDGSIVDRETGTRWRYDGEAVEGPLAGSRLAPVEDAYVAFWFAWAVFQPGTDIWTYSP